MSPAPHAADDLEKPARLARIKAVLPDLWALVRPRSGTLLLGLGLVGLSRIASLAAPAAMKLLIDDVLGKRRVDLLVPIVAGVALATLTQSAISYAQTTLFSRSTQRLIAELRCTLEAHVLRLPLLYHDEHKSGEIGSRILNDVLGLQNLVGTGLLNFVGTLFTAALALAVMAHFSPKIAAVALVCVAVAAVAAAMRTRRVNRIAWERGDLVADMYGRLMESLGGVRVIKTYRAEPREQAIFAENIDRLVDNALKTVKLSSGLELATTALWGLVNAVVMLVGIRYVLDGALTLGSFFTISVLLNYLAAPALQIGGIGSLLMEALAGLERMRQILALRREDEDPRRTLAIGPLRGELAFDDVSFAYEPGKPVLHGVSFHAAPGTVTALVGPSGSGKSTISGLIATFYVPGAGTIRVDGHDLGTLRLDSYRAQLGAVLQETFLFAGSILDNIAFARPDATRDEILAAAKSARVDEFAEKLERGYETRVGERGVRLSGGQRQRISIARALLADPKILLLDEATSSLDTTSEALIQEALARLLVGRTTFVIAHRLSTIRRADQILVIDQGRIVERGTHADLLAQRGLYADMFHQQHQVEADLFLAPGEQPSEIADMPPLPAEPAVENDHG
jgi:ABC-type multidrug transport system fused ATPase/permease subunit